MNILFPLVLGTAILILASRTYAFYLCRKIGVDDSCPTPAHRLKDGRDYVPTRMHIVFAHHFSVIAGAGPIVGPVLALIYGWSPVWLWIVLGASLFGAVHDMTSMYVSLKEDGKSIADMSRRTLGGAGYFLYVSFLVMSLTLINAVFLNLSCKALTASYPATLLKLDPTHPLIHTFIGAGGVLMGRIGGIATTSVFVITLFAPFMGWLAYKKNFHTSPLYILAAAICVISVLAGFHCPILLSESAWRWVMSGYVFLACWVPVWVILQPRDFVNVQILYAGIFVMLTGLVVGGAQGMTFQTNAFNVAEGVRYAGSLWPFLFITVACGAISGFHSMAATGTTVKQIRYESKVRRVGYNAMILEAILAMASMILVCAMLPHSEYLSIVYPASGDGNPILAFAVAMGYMLERLAHVPTAVGSVMGILVLEGFVVTTLDTGLRLCRYMLEEFWEFIFGRRTPGVLKNRLFNTFLSVGLMLFFAFNSTILSAWKVFGAGNQLIAAISLVIVTIWLLQKGRSFWFTILPACFMFVTTVVTLGLVIRRNLLPAGAGTFFRAGQGPLTIAALFLLALAVAVTVIAVRRFTEGWSARKP